MKKLLVQDLSVQVKVQATILLLSMKRLKLVTGWNFRLTQLKIRTEFVTKRYQKDYKDDTHIGNYNPETGNKHNCYELAELRRNDNTTCSYKCHLTLCLFILLEAIKCPSQL